MSSVFVVFFISIAVWAYWTFSDIHSRRYLTQLQKKRYEDAAITMLIALFGVSMAEVAMLEYFDVKTEVQIPIILCVNMMIVFLFRDRDREDNKTIYAAQKKNFNLPIKKTENIKSRVKEESHADMHYYHIEPVFRKHDMTVDHVKLAPYTITEYRELFIKSMKMPFKPHIVYRHLIAYYNTNGAKYGLPKVDYEDFTEKLATSKRGSAELYITTLYLRLNEKRIPVRISQLLQHATDMPYLNNYIYFLMGIPSGRYVSNAVLYAIFHLNHHKEFKGKK